MMLTMSTMGLSMISLGFSVYFKESLGDSPVITVIPILCVSLYLFAFGAGKWNIFCKVKNLFYFKALVLFSVSFLLNYFLQTIKYYQVST